MRAVFGKVAQYIRSLADVLESPDGVVNARVKFPEIVNASFEAFGVFFRQSGKYVSAGVSIRGVAIVLPESRGRDR